MPLPKDMLNQNEEIVLDIHPHWWYFAESVGVLIPIMIAEIYIATKIDGGFWNFLPKSILKKGSLFKRLSKYKDWKDGASCFVVCYKSNTQRP